MLYPFGFGLSYTNFNIDTDNISEASDYLSVTVTVTNIGMVPGKEVAEIYVEAPQGLLGKPSRVLAGFKKTGILNPGCSETLNIDIPFKNFASFDEDGRCNLGTGFVLEKGNYYIFVGSDVRSARKAGTFEVPEDGKIMSFNELEDMFFTNKDVYNPQTNELIIGANEYIEFVRALRRGTGIKQAQAAYENFLRLIGRSEEQIAEAVRHINSKEQRIMKDIDHKLSRQIVNEAVKHNVSVIRLETLNNIRNSTRKSRKNNHSIHTWSFYRLAMYIEYKAKLAGITIEYVDPAYTSQKCPKCGDIHHAEDRSYVCTCGYHTHRDIVGAMNICASTERVGGSNARHAA